MSTTDVVGLDLRIDPDLSLADKVRRAGQARAIVAFAKDLEAHAKTELETAARADVKEAGGGGFSRTVDGVRATVSDPQPRPHVTDEAAFVTWLLEHTDVDVQTVERVEVVDQGIALQVLYDSDDPPHEWVHKAFRVVTEYRLPEKVLDTLVESGRCIAKDAGLIDPTTGETVPGVECSRAASTLSVTPSKQAKARDRAIVASFFNLPAELPSGGGA